MKIKYKFLTILFIMAMLLFSSGITYSIFNSGSTLSTEDQQIAKFVFNANMVDYIELPLTNLNPGDIDEYLFSVSNSQSENLSNITVEYQITVKTYHFMPLNIELYKIDNTTETLVMSCNEAEYSRNTSNELICNSPIQIMSYANEAIDNYKLKITFPSEKNSEVYADLVDYIDLEISSWQKIDEQVG